MDSKKNISLHLGQQYAISPITGHKTSPHNPTTPGSFHPAAPPPALFPNSREEGGAEK